MGGFPRTRVGDCYACVLLKEGSEEKLVRKGEKQDRTEEAKQRCGFGRSCSLIPLGALEWELCHSLTHLVAKGLPYYTPTSTGHWLWAAPGVEGDSSKSPGQSFREVCRYEHLTPGVGWGVPTASTAAASAFGK